MEPTDRQIRHVSQITTTIALAIAVLLAMVPPVAYYWAVYSSTRGAMEAESTINTRLIGEIVTRNPEFWKLQELHLQSVLSRRPANKIPEIRRVIDESGRLVAESADRLAKPTNSVLAPIFDSGKEVGQLEISRSLFPLIQHTGVIALISCTLAVLSFFGLRQIPIRALHKALAEIVSSREEAQQATLEKKKAETEAHMRSMFLANMSHELRTPMNGVIGMLDLALDAPLDAEQKEHLDLARQSAQHLMHILNDILDFSKIDAGKLNIHPVATSLPELLDTLAKTASISARQKGLSLTCEWANNLPQRIVTDPDRLRQILMNLVGNAIKFTHQGQVILGGKIAFSGGARFVDLTVEDTGIGIPEDKLAAIFRPFTQADGSTTKRFGGTGLGLTIAKQLAEKMGGRLWVTSTLERGSIFHLYLPLGDLPEATATLPRADIQSAAAANGDDHESRRMLHLVVAEESAVNRRLIDALLRKANYRATFVSTGKEALEVDERHIDMYLVELEAARRLRDRGCQRPIIALTSQGIEGIREKCQEAGVDAYITKPIDAKTLIETLHRASSLAASTS